ncbi:hypothetical protein WUBG_10390 [Wuchereria bancrofti]|uniref:Bm12971 n=3 Tax=Onchocercidae TaxID=6296 RepID=A0A0K0IWF7_BRUMA|nr:Uncharacterized protein BM_BM12971 [Brugia malayi]EJW78699.1 hypothetical protein WUBG_10390 [Wuchereria bancrofti]CDQ02877.1 Bm12971 [Brugia malayi]VDN82529.1 unnamed protein product [Brugia pahangi]VIO96852.1 Uncharacterized protein BM_BM12971 [Brugia malayi]
MYDGESAPIGRVTFGRSITVSVLVEMLLMNKGMPSGTIRWSLGDVQQLFYPLVESWSVDPSSYVR